MATLTSGARRKDLLPFHLANSCDRVQSAILFLDYVAGFPMNEIFLDETRINQ